MPKFRCELYGHFIFNEELSYSDLLEREARLKEELTQLLSQAECAHIHLVSTGDFLLAQGALAEYDQDLFHELCEGVSQLLDANVQARLLFVDRFLDSVYFYTLTSETWQEAVFDFPLPKEAAAAARPDPPTRGKRVRPANTT